MSNHPMSQLTFWDKFNQPVFIDSQTGLETHPAMIIFIFRLAPVWAMILDITS
jgi:hypothetical protein